MLRKVYNVIAFLVTDVERDAEVEEKVLKKIMRSPQNKCKNTRDLRTLIDIYPGTLRVKGVKVAVFTQDGVSVSDAVEEFGERFSEGLTEDLSTALARHGRKTFYGYKLEGVFTFDEPHTKEFSEFFPLLLSGNANNVLFITDDKLNLLYTSGVLDREVLKKYLVVERAVLLQPFEYTEQIVKYVYVPLADTKFSKWPKPHVIPTGAILFTTFYSPLLKINGFKARYRKVSKMRRDAPLRSRKGEPFVSFHDDAIDSILRELRFNVGSVPESVEKLFKVIAIVTNPRIFPVLSGYIDYAGLYGASQLLRGYTTDRYARVEDIESKLDLMLRGHLSREHGLDAGRVSSLISRLSYSPAFTVMREVMKGMLGNDETLNGDIVALALAFALSVVKEERLRMLEMNEGFDFL